RLFNQADVVEERRAVEPLRGARKGRETAFRRERGGVGDPPCVEVPRQPPERRFDVPPPLERGQETRRDEGCARGALLIAGDNEQPPVDRSVVVGREPHGSAFRSGNAGLEPTVESTLCL